ncbi:MAG: histidine triad nucleotide-binding protein [Pseudomonadota bacterium]|uniref:histidine triad nucleotide-binding protein n=1 Tax=Thalassovita sp. TaxID=1979401 RepID=UPI002AB292FE|nr:histidine triad nucleotide-binding protein [Thalassovita sp.]MEC7963683.1 histidine triad nucleotide-binding protein [Pseudomonadota bacterium]MEC8041084.1 histidine triad nucleotide-binding protein [Pseudomonadota bacterium]MEC8293477.1 histidine triad nucleotide-binding protein [Pseudomonadota bacterium]
MAYVYDEQNIFAKILRGEIPNKTVLETEHALAFHDIQPQAPVHVLVIPKGPYVCYDHFALEASDAEIVGFNRAVGEVCKMLEIQPGEGGDGYRVISNAGENGVQEVPHLHVHVLGGRWLGRMLKKAE